ncbi:MAG: hypothetical protein ACO3SO_00060 [Luteolibacter sp.]
MKPTLPDPSKPTALVLAGAVAIPAILTCFSFTAQAATLWTGATDLNYGTAGNWDNGSPGNNDQAATINNGDTVSLATNHTGTNTYNLVVGGNSTLNASAAFTATGLTIQNSGAVNLTGGAFTLPQTSVSNNGSGAAGKLQINAGGTLNISGGTHVFNERSYIYGNFRVTGSAATISMHQIATSDQAVATFDFIFDSGGVSTITGAGGFPWFSIQYSLVTVSNSGFVGTGSFTLFDCDDAGSMMTADKFTVTGFGAEGVGWTLDIVDNPSGALRDTVVLNIIPEPSAALLGGLGMLALLRRRRHA